MRIDILTTFPEMFAAEPPAALGVSIPGRARKAGLVEIVPTNVRDFAPPPHRKTDDRPFGGGPGMVMTPQPLWDAVQAAEAADARPAVRILMTPQGEPLRQQTVEELAKLPRLLIIAGHYEGIDERVIQRLAPRQISVGDYVLSGGELAAMVLIDAVIRLLPGALGHAEGAHQESFGAPPGRDAIGAAIPAKALRELGLPPGAPPPRLLDCPHYTRPQVWDGLEVPAPLLSGDHQAVARWRLGQMLERTRALRPDLLEPEGPA